MAVNYLKAIPLILAIFLAACSDDNPKPDQYIRLNVNGVEDLNVTGSIGSTNANPILSNVTAEDNGALATNTVQIGTIVVDKATSTASKSLSISLQGITQAGTYDLVKNEGIFVYSTATQGTFQEGYYISLTEHGSCSVTIEKIGDKAQPGIGRPIKGTFSATVLIDEEGNTHSLTGEFNGGV